MVWTRVSGDAATISADGTFVPVPGKTGDVELRATATVGGNGYSLSRTVHVIDPAAVRSLRVEGPELIDLYDVPGGLYRAFATTADGEYEVTPVWSADGIGTRYMQISAVGELSFYYDTYTVYQCATAVVTAAYCGLTSSAQTLLYGPGYVTPVQVGIDQNAIWPGAEVELVPRKVQWWRHGVLEEPTDDFSDVAFGWELYCEESGWNNGNGTAVAVPADALSTNGTAVLYLNAFPARERYWDDQSKRFDVNFLDAPPAGWTTITFDPADGEVFPESARYVPGLPYRFLPTPSKKGYSGGWYTEREGGDSVTDDSTVPSADTTLHAHWSANYYWIVFHANGAEGTMSDQYFYYDRPGRLRTNAFTMEGDTFAGWALSPEGEVVFADGAEILNLRDSYDIVNLYAVWLGTWESGLSRLPDGATAGEVATAIAAAGFADPGIARAVAGNPATFNALVEWASSVKGADGASPAGTAAVIADPHSAAAFLLGAERLFAGAPAIGIESLGFGGADGALSVGIAVRDGASVVPVSAEKVGAMFEAADSPSGWTDASVPAVDASGTDADGRMRFEVRSGTPASGRFFLRIRK